MALMYTRGEPSKVAEKALPALYGSVYKLKFELKKKGVTFEFGKLRARCPDAHLLPKGQRTGIWGLSVPQDTKSLPQKVPEIEVKLELWNSSPDSSRRPLPRRGSNSQKITWIHLQEWLRNCRRPRRRRIPHNPKSKSTENVNPVSCQKEIQ